jgi:hypothetical protein
MWGFFPGEASKKELKKTLLVNVASSILVEHSLDQTTPDSGPLGPEAGSFYGKD